MRDSMIAFIDPGSYSASGESMFPALDPIAVGKLQMLTPRRGL